MRKWTLGIGMTLLALVAGAIGLFCWQNATLTVPLVFLRFGLETPISAPLLMAICLGSGFLSGSGIFLVRGMATSRKLRALEQQLALTTDRGSEWR